MGMVLLVLTFDFFESINKGIIHFEVEVLQRPIVDTNGVITRWSGNIRKEINNVISCMDLKNANLLLEMLITQDGHQFLFLAFFAKLEVVSSHGVVTSTIELVRSIFAFKTMIASCAL